MKHQTEIVKNLEKDVEILIVGAGIIGSALAMNLGRMGAKSVRVVDVELDGALSSTELNAGGVRATFNQRINIELSKASIHYFSSVANEVGYRACGYLWLHRPDTFARAQSARSVYEQMKWPTELWDVARIRSQIPFIDKTEDLAGALFAQNDGLINSNRLKNHFRDEAKKCGVEFVDRFYLQEFDSKTGQVSASVFEGVLGHEEKLQVFSEGKLPQSAYRVSFKTQKIVNCSGAWAGWVAKKMGYQTFSTPIRRQVALFDCREVDLNQYGMIVDASGVYFHPEATFGMSGVADRNEREGINFHFDGESYFMDQIWPHLYERSTAFEKLKFLNGWAGLYEVSPDESAIIGQVSDRIYESHSYSGHGVMHSYATGLALAEKILTGHYESFDLDILSGRRFETGKLISETAVI